MLAADTMQLGHSNYPRWLDSESSKFYWASHHARCPVVIVPAEDRG